MAGRTKGGIIMNKLKLSPPWAEYVNKIKALFEKDHDIRVEYDEDKMNLVIKVDDTDKYEALTKLLPEMKDFGGVELLITIIPANTKTKNSSYYIKKLFSGNNSVVEIQDVTIGTNPMTFVSFEKEVIQYYNDNIGDLHGLRSTLMENIAREVFEDLNGVYFCTDNDACMPW